MICLKVYASQMLQDKDLRSRYHPMVSISLQMEDRRILRKRTTPRTVVQSFLLASQGICNRKAVLSYLIIINTSSIFLLKWHFCHCEHVMLQEWSVQLTHFFIWLPTFNGMDGPKDLLLDPLLVFYKSRKLKQAPRFNIKVIVIRNDRTPADPKPSSRSNIPRDLFGY